MQYGKGMNSMEAPGGFYPSYGYPLALANVPQMPDPSGEWPQAQGGWQGYLQDGPPGNQAAWLQGRRLWSLGKVRKKEPEKVETNEWIKVEAKPLKAPKATIQTMSAHKADERRNRFQALINEDGAEEECEVEEPMKDDLEMKPTIGRRWNKGQKPKTTKKGLAIIKRAGTQQLNNIETSKYEMIEITVDSGAE